MRKQEVEAQVIHAQEAIIEFTKIFVKNYPLVFKEGKFVLKVEPTDDERFPYEVSVKIKKH